MRSKIRGYVGGVCGDGDRRGEVYLLPAGRGFASKRRAAQEDAGPGPDVADVSALVRACLVEAHAGDVAADVGSELDADFN